MGHVLWLLQIHLPESLYFLKIRDQLVLCKPNCNEGSVFRIPRYFWQCMSVLWLNVGYNPRLHLFGFTLLFSKSRWQCFLLKKNTLHWRDFFNLIAMMRGKKLGFWAIWNCLVSTHKKGKSKGNELKPKISRLRRAKWSLHQFTKKWGCFF